MSDKNANFIADKRASTAVDSVVGSNIRDLRILAGLTQSRLADLLRMTYQQVHKYEAGINRISAGRLWTFAKIFNCEISDLFKGADLPKAERTPAQRERLKLMKATEDLKLEDISHLLYVARFLATRTNKE